MTRDNQVWNILGLVGIVLGVLVATITDPAAYGISPVVMRWLGLASVLLAALLKFANSQLPGENDAKKIDVSKIAPSVVALALVLPLTGCHKNLVFESPTAKVAYTCEQILKPIGALQDSVIQTEAKGSLPTKDAILAMHALRIIEKVLVDVPKGWKTAAVTAAWNTGVAVLALPKDMPATWQETIRVVWAALKARVPVLSTNQYIAVAWALVDGMIGG